MRKSSKRRRPRDLDPDQVADLRVFLEAESTRADAHQRYLIALVASAFAGLYLVSRHIQPAILQDHYSLALGCGLGAIVFTLVVARLIAQLVDVLQPRRMAFLLNPQEAAAIDRCVEALGLPASMRLMRTMPIFAGTVYLVMLLAALRNGDGASWLVLVAIVIAVASVLSEVWGSLATGTFVRTQWARMHAIFWEHFGLTKGMKADDPDMKRILTLAKKSVLLPRARDVSTSIKYFHASNRLSDVIVFLIHGSAAISIVWSTYLRFGFNEAFHLLAPVAAFVVLALTATSGFLLVALDSWKAHLGQLRFLAFAKTYPQRDVAIAYMALEALRERKIFYAVPAGVLVANMRSDT